jgi:hypothetical protein
MKRSVLLLALFGASAVFSSAYAVQPMKGSLTWGDGANLHYPQLSNGNQNLKLPYRVYNEFQNELTGEMTAKEIYALNTDGTLRLLSRWFVNNDHPDPKPERIEKPKPVDDEIDIPK